MSLSIHVIGEAWFIRVHLPTLVQIFKSMSFAIPPLGLGY